MVFLEFEYAEGVKLTKQKIMTNWLMPINWGKHGIHPNVAKARGLQRQGIKGEVVIYFEPLITWYLKSPRFPVG